MAMILKHDLPKHRIGDTFPGEIFRLVENVSGVPTPVDLTGARIRMDVRLQAKQPLVMRFTNYATNDPAFPGGGLEILDPTDGKWWIAKQVLSPIPAVYVYDIEFTFPVQEGQPPEIETLIEGNWAFEQDVTHD